jgi:enoyl-CoA hydratase/3-hydroxyacyl-CoA dehydrogenase
LSNSEVKSKLEELAAKLDCSIFAPTKSIVEGRMREAIEGRLAVEAVRPVPSGGGAPEAPKEAGPVYLEKLAGGVARIVINRPKLNTMNAEVLDGLDRILTELSSDKDVRVVILTAKGSIFSAGADLSQYFSNSVAFMEYARRGARTIRRLTEFPKLTIAVLKGVALGGGLELAMSCDIRIATEDVELRFPELTLGLVPGWSGSQRMAQLVGLSRASSMILTSERINGRRAFEMGLVNRLVPSGDPDEYAVGYGRELASTLAPVAVMLAKRLLNKGTEVPSDVGLEMEAMASGTALL